MRISLALALAACGSSHHAAIDAPPDTGDAGRCGGDVFFTGELVDFDSTDANFCGVFGATLTVDGDATRSATTRPNGRYELCLAAAPQTRVDVAPPAAPSECTMPASTYALPGILIASQDVIAASAFISARTFTVARAPDFGYRANAAQLLVHVDGTPRAVSIDVAHDPAQVFTTAWAAGDTGANVFFPNVDPAAGATTIAVVEGAIGAGSVPIAAGTFTYVTVVAN